MAQSDGSDLDLSKRQRVRDLQPELQGDYPHHLPLGTLLFRCPRCTRVYPLNHFPRNHQRHYGIRTICRACLRATRPKDRHEPDPDVTHKTCSLCHVCRPVSAFWIDRSQPDGYSPYCTLCSQRRREERTASHDYDDALAARREQTLALCGELGIDYPGHDIMRCRHCREVKPVSEFVNDSHYTARKKPVCLDCHAQKSPP